MPTFLEPKFDSRGSFHKKAKIREEGNRKILTSYSTDVAYIEGKKAVVLGQWGVTTTRHIKEFLKQNGFMALTKKQIWKDYGVKE